MTDDHNTPDKKTFDMYHFFSRKDILAVIALLLFFVIWMVHHFLTTGKQV